MRRLRSLLLVSLVLGLIAGAAVPALAGAARPASAAPGRVPAGVRRVTVTLAVPPELQSSHKSVRRTFTSAVKVLKLADAVDSLQIAKLGGACPMYIRIGPVLTVAFRSASGSLLAQASVEVAFGTRGASATSACFPIHFASGGHTASLLGNGFVRLVGRMIGTPIS